MTKQSRFWSRLLVLSYALPRLFFSRHKPNYPQRILIAHHLLLGDTIMLAGLFKKLRREHPHANIDVLLPTAYLPIFAGHPYGVHALPYDLRAINSLRKLLSQEPYDWALVPADNRWAWLARAMGARWITAFSGGDDSIKNWPVDEFVDWPQTPETWGDIASRLVLGREPDAFIPDEWPAPPLPQDFPALPQNPYAVLHVGASSPHKFWLSKNWLALANTIKAAGLTVIWSSGTSEAEKILAKAADPKSQFIHLTGQYDLAGLWHLIAGADLLVSTDTGIAHLARLTNTPTVVLFGPGSPIVSGPGRFWQNSPVAVVWEKNITCRNQNLLFERRLPWVQHCWRSVAECGQPHCMWAINNQQVIQAIEQITDIVLVGE